MAGRGAIEGIAEASPHKGITLGNKPDAYPRPVAAAVERLLHSGISGPYGLALGGEEYQRVVEAAEHGGYPLLEHLRKILDGPIIWAPGVEGAVVVSLRGGDFLFESGQDLSIGYDEPRRRGRSAVPGGELQLPRRHAGGRSPALLADNVQLTAPLSASWTSAATSADNVQLGTRGSPSWTLAAIGAR